MITPIAITLLVSISGYDFPGGTPTDFARSIAAWSHKPAVMLLDAEHPAVPKIRIATDDKIPVKDIARLFKSKANIDIVVGDTVGLSFCDIPAEILDFEAGPQSRPGKVEVLETNPNKWLDNGKVTVSDPSRPAVLVKNLQDLQWKKPLSVHWLYQPLRITCAVNGASEVEFLTAVANAVGGVFINDKDKYVIDLSPKVIRDRALSHYSQKVVYSDWERKELVAGRKEVGQEFVYSVWTIIKDEEIRDLYESRYRFVVVDCSRLPNLSSLIARKVDVLKRTKEKETPENMAVQQGMMDMIDLSKPPRASVVQTTNAAFMWRRKGGGSVVL